MANYYAQHVFSIGRSAFFSKLRQIRRREPFFSAEFETEKHLRNLRSQGYSIVENFLSADVCAEMRDQVDKAILRFPDAVWSGCKGADNRVFGIEHLGGRFQEYFDNPFALQVGNQYFGGRLENLQVLAGRIDAIDGNIGSGEGWHKDGNHFQYKAIVYLSDAGIDNGPFQLIKGSHHFIQVIKDNRRMGLDSPLEVRFTEDQVNRLVHDEPSRLATLSAPAGTMILADTSTIHRGSPITNGRRYALFNYYYPSYDIKGRKEKFLPRLTPEMAGIPA